jgi:2-polyprenyl-3-methyl-5-hydroxy-6-metoxy-1,4-benzoquinol methylase
MSLKNDNKKCIVCGNPYRKYLLGFSKCAKCKLIYSGQKSGFGNCIQGMKSIAFKNYKIIADVLDKKIKIRGLKILDVGCAEGGFTDLMISKGALTLGIEPDINAAKDAIFKKIPIKISSFESLSGSKNKFDVIVFNDVFEHMSDPHLTLFKSVKMLNRGGLILINLPVSSGFIFKIVTLLAKIGIKSPYKRIWAQGLSSPHIYFYNENNLTALLNIYKFELIDKGRLVSLSAEGMYDRVRSTYGPFISFFISIFAIFLNQISKHLPSDVLYLLFKKNEKKT